MEGTNQEIGKKSDIPLYEEMIEDWKHLKDNEVTIFKLLAYSGCRFSHGVLKNAPSLKYEIEGYIAYINTESLTKHTSCNL
jgi:hypothetical protein